MPIRLAGKLSVALTIALAGVGASQAVISMLQGPYWSGRISNVHDQHQGVCELGPLPEGLFELAEFLAERERNPCPEQNVGKRVRARLTDFVHGAPQDKISPVTPTRKTISTRARDAADTSPVWSGRGACELGPLPDTLLELVAFLAEAERNPCPAVSSRRGDWEPMAKAAGMTAEAEPEQEQEDRPAVVSPPPRGASKAATGRVPADSNSGGSQSPRTGGQPDRSPAQRPAVPVMGHVVVVERGWWRQHDVTGREVADEAQVFAVEVVERGWWRQASDEVAEGVPLVRPVPSAAPVAAVRMPRLSQDVPLAKNHDHSSHPDTEPVAENRIYEVVVRTSGGEHEDMPMLFADATVVDEEVMATLRGGFQTPGGLMISFGIERAVYVNGVLSSTTTLTVSELGKLVGGSADAVNALQVGTSLGLIQNGPNNTFVGDMMTNGAFATVIQNSLDNQQIQTITTINTQVNSMDLLRTHRLGESLRDALNFR